MVAFWRHNERKILASICLYSLGAWLYLLTVGALDYLYSGSVLYVCLLSVYQQPVFTAKRVLLCNLCSQEKDMAVSCENEE